jgi:hypothetical protein
MRGARSGHRRLASTLVLLLLVTLAAAGCAGVNRLREAQASFNEAAALENELRLEAGQQEGATIQAPLAQNTTVQNGYASALLSLERLEARDVARLKRDKLWGNVLALRALAQWKLGLLDQARDTAREVQQAGAEQVHPRDRALLLALPGLIKTDEAFAALARLPGEPSAVERAATLKNVQTLVADAGESIDRGRATIDAAHPVHVYLIQARLAALRNLQVAHERLGDGEARTLPREPRIEVQRQLKELKCHAERLGARPEIVTYWATRFTLAPDPGAC